MTEKAFLGAKIMPFLGDRLLVVQRDHTPGIPWPGWLDFPGGVREGDETPAQTALRETREEVGLVLAESDLRLAHLQDVQGRRAWFFAAHLAPEREAEVVFGNEGLGWRLMSPDAFLHHPEAIPHFKEVLRGYLALKEESREDAPPGQ